MSTPKGPTLAVLPDANGEAPASSQILEPGGWPAPKGYANGMAADGRIVVTGGVIGRDSKERLADGFAAQVRQTLSNIAAILAEGGARPEHLRGSPGMSSQDKIWRTWRARQNLPPIFGTHYPAMALIQVVRLVEAGCAGRDQSDRGGTA